MSRFKSLLNYMTEDEQDYFLDVVLRLIKDASHCMSSTNTESEKLGTETRLLLKTHPQIKETMVHRQIITVEE